MAPLPAQPSSLLAIGFIALSVLLGAFWIWAAGRTASSNPRRSRAVTAAALSSWAAATAIFAGRAWMHDFTAFPPPVLRLFMFGLVATVFFALSPFGRQMASGLPLAVLVGFQAFRIPVELLLHRAHHEGLLPIQMTYLGRNFDVLAGVSALVLGFYLARARGELPPRLTLVVAGWNVLSLGLLLNIVVVAILSMPTRMRMFDTEPANVLVTYFPFIWLPALLVTSALFGHLLVFRRLRRHAG